MANLLVSEHSPIKWSSFGHCGSITSQAAAYTTVTGVNISAVTFYAYFSGRNTTGMTIMANTATTRTPYVSASSRTDNTMTVRYKHVAGGKFNWFILY